MLEQPASTRAATKPQFSALRWACRDPDRSCTGREFVAVIGYVRGVSDSPAPYGDRSPAQPSTPRAAPWHGGALGLLIVALVSFAGAGIALIVAIVRIWVTLAQDTGADIAVGLVLTACSALVLTGCATTAAANRKRHS